MVAIITSACLIFLTPSRAAAISISSPPDLNLGTITGSGTVNGSAIWSVSTLALFGYSLYWKSNSATMTSGSNTIAAYTPTIANTPETWSVASSDSEWGARLSSHSTDTDSEWGTDGVSEKWLNVATSNRKIVSRGLATVLVSDEIVQFKVQVGTNHFQPSGSYVATVTMTAMDN